VDPGRDRMRPGEQAEETERDEQHGGDREEGVVGERGGQVRNVVVAGLLEGAPDDRQVVALGKIGESWVSLARFLSLGLRRRHILERRLVRNRPFRVIVIPRASSRVRLRCKSLIAYLR